MNKYQEQVFEIKADLEQERMELLEEIESDRRLKAMTIQSVIYSFFIGAIGLAGSIMVKLVELIGKTQLSNTLLFFIIMLGVGTMGTLLFLGFMYSCQSSIYENNRKIHYINRISDNDEYLERAYIIK